MTSENRLPEFTKVRDLFPVVHNLLYFDSAHQTPLATSVRSALDQFYDEGQHSGGPKAVWLARAEATRQQLADLLHASAREIAFTKNTSEGLNVIANALALKSGDEVLMVQGDHPNNSYAWLNLQSKGVRTHFVPLESEVASAQTFAPFITEHTKVISLSHVTFHAGQRNALASIGALCQKHGIHLVVDAMQSIGVLDLDVKALGISALAAGCHKGLLIPQGLGLLYVDGALEGLKPAYLGIAGVSNPPADMVATAGDYLIKRDAGQFELGNLNLPALYALSASLRLLQHLGLRAVEEHVLKLGDRLIEHLDRLGIDLVGPRSRENRLHIYVLKLSLDPWMKIFETHQVRVSPDRDGIRVSFGIFNTFEEVDRLAGILEENNYKVV